MSSTFDFSLNDLDPKTIGRITKWLDTKANTKFGIVTYREYLERWGPVAKLIGNKMYRYNRRLFNRLDAAGQTRYMANLNKAEFNLVNGDDCQMTCPKIIFDNIALPEVQP